ncbi:hypothetical protein BLNAU_14211 [Blattamonas nauphoetae]|uniref:Uncharacterized protein n=1 Tax=Blattamonas nauphoetae TaxID=2049346 RepID=A0ABQ9XHK8_9EUKA|nr:hypothetical protein BLNAU_14211 [Blattamonas nauphoetae]
MDHRDPHRVVDGNLVFDSTLNLLNPCSSHFCRIWPMKTFLPSFESSRIKIQSSILTLKGIHPPVADRGRMIPTDIIINARPDPGSDGLVHADTHLTMAKCVPERSLCLILPSPPVLQPSS